MTALGIADLIGETPGALTIQDTLAVFTDSVAPIAVRIPSARTGSGVCSCLLVSPTLATETAGVGTAIAIFSAFQGTVAVVCAEQSGGTVAIESAAGPGYIGKTIGELSISETGRHRCVGPAR